jgi:protocatechuate 3,4-dioxygenase beta subunit
VKRRAWIVPLAASLFALSGIAQSNLPLTGPYRIAGTVTNAETNQPVRGALVSILTVDDSRTFASTQTDSDGRFAFERLPAEKFQLTASKRGYVTGFYDQHGDFNSAIVTGASQSTGNLDTSSLVFKLEPGAVLSGVVTGDGGDPVERAAVLLFREPAGRGRDAAIEHAGTETTDDTGAYEFTGLQAGAYLLAVQAKPWYAMHRFNTAQTGAPETEQQAALDLAYPVTYFDSTTDEPSATPIELTGGSRQEANINLHAVPALHLNLSMPERPGRESPPTDLRQMIFGEPTGGEYEEVFGAPGGAEIEGLAPGHYEIQQGDPPRMVDMNLSASQQLDASAGVATVEVAGLVKDTRGARAGDGTAILYPELGTAGMTISQPVQKGAFRLQAVPPGEWRLKIALVAGGVEPVVSVTAGGKTQAGDRISVGEQPVSLVAVVTAQVTRLEGFARRDGKGVAGVMVVLLPKDPAGMPSLVRRDQSDSDGSFTLLNVAPGAYTVVAIADGWDLDWSDPGGMRRYLPRGVSVTVKDDSGSAAGAQAPRRIQLAQAVPVQAR